MKNPHNKKVETEVIVESYKRLGNVWKVGKEVGLCGQSVHQRLKKLGLCNRPDEFTEEEIQKIKEFYSSMTSRKKGALKAFSDSLGKDKANVCRKAKRLGLTSQNRPLSEEVKLNISVKNKQWHNTNEHPKGMKGKTHSQEYCDELGKRASEWFKNANEDQLYNRNRKTLETKHKNKSLTWGRGSWKADWRDIGGKHKFFRSKWEANYGRYLELLKQQGYIKDWDHEPELFWFEGIKRGVTNYTPDFKVINNDDSHYWVEVKGWMCPKSKTKIKRFGKYFPKEKLIVVEADWFKKNNKNCRIACPGWE